MDPYGEEDAVKLMEEMTRFEAEIGGTNPSLAAGLPPRPIIGANTFDLMQKKLESAGKSKSDSLDSLSMTIPPPPPPPTGALPSGFPAVIPSAAFAGIPPPPPPPPFMVPHNVRTPRATPLTTRLPPPPPPLVSSGINFKNKPVVLAKPASKSVVLSAAPTKYDKNDPVHTAHMDEELNNFFLEIKKEEEEMNRVKLGLSSAKKMADSVKASTVVSIQPVTSYDDMYGNSGKRGKKNKKLVRMAGGQVWEDPSLQEWEDDDFRIFCGDLGNDVTDEVLTRAFNKYPSFMKAKVVRDKRTNKTKGFGFVSFKDPQDFIKAMKEMNGRYVGSRPIKLRKSTWKARSLESVKKKEKEKAVLINLLTGR